MSAQFIAGEDIKKGDLVTVGDDGKLCKWPSETEPPRLRYWQHGETGRVCATTLQPSERWYEIYKAEYDQIAGAMVNKEPVQSADVDGSIWARSWWQRYTQDEE